MKPIVALVAGLTLCWSTVSRSEEFKLPKSNVIKEGSIWIEYPPYSGNTHFTFTELKRTNDILYLWDGYRALILMLPFNGGTAAWIKLDNVTSGDLGEATYTK